ncbi:MAG: PilZ domain-containing protein [Phycisphaerae bacterium]|nr:PilZ domain-containing protein [Phycisphaerae bacterium]
MDEDRRRHERFPLKLSIFCQRVGHSGGKLYTGRTINVGPGGILVEMKSNELREGELLCVEMTVPPTEGLLEFGGSFSSYARVVRNKIDKNLVAEAPFAEVVALEFCDSPKLRV